jgi:hypothetical protein
MVVNGSSCLALDKRAVNCLVLTVLVIALKIQNYSSSSIFTNSSSSRSSK